MFVGGDAQAVKTYYAPDLGHIPKWCSHLEGATEELLEAKKQTYYDNYRFVTEKQIEEMKAQKEIGKSIKPHMHGYLMPIAMYNKKASMIKDEQAK